MISHFYCYRLCDSNFCNCNHSILHRLSCGSEDFTSILSRQLKRLESATRSPVYSHFSETLAGAATIRAFAVDHQFINESDLKVETNQKCKFMIMALNQWLGLVLSFLGNTLVFLAALFAVLSRDNLNAGLTGLAITYSMQISQFLNWFTQLLGQGGDRDCFCGTNS